MAEKFSKVITAEGSLGIDELKTKVGAYGWLR